MQSGRREQWGSPTGRQSEATEASLAKRPNRTLSAPVVVVAAAAFCFIGALFCLPRTMRCRCVCPPASFWTLCALNFAAQLATAARVCSASANANRSLGSQSGGNFIHSALVLPLGAIDPSSQGSAADAAVRRRPRGVNEGEGFAARARGFRGSTAPLAPGARVAAAAVAVAQKKTDAKVHLSRAR